MRLFKYVLILSGFVFMTTIQGAPGASARNLSQAMEKAAEEDENDRIIDSPEAHHHHDHDHHDHHNHHSCGFWYFIGDILFPDNDEEYATEPQQTGPTLQNADTEQEENLPAAVSISGGSGIFKGDDFYPMVHLDVSFGGYFSRKTRPELYLGLGFADIDESELLDNAIRGSVKFFTAGLRIKKYTTPLDQSVGHYFVGGLAYTAMSWRYENEIYVDGDTVEHDGISGLEAFCGMGFHLAQTRRTQIGLEVLPTVIWWSSETDKGFDNDVFGDPLMLKVRLVVSWLW